MNLQVGFRLTYLFPDWAEKSRVSLKSLQTYKPE